MQRAPARMPVSCPANFSGHYTVLPGDTINKIAQIFRTDIQVLVQANPHIANPNIIFPGDILCVPGQIPFPCCNVLKMRQPLALGEVGAVFPHISLRGTQAVTVVAALLPPSTTQGFDTWIAELIIPNVGNLRQQLYPTPEDPPTWSTTIDLPTAASLTPTTRLVIRPSLKSTGELGPIVLENTLSNCR